MTYEDKLFKPGEIAIWFWEYMYMHEHMMVRLVQLQCIAKLVEHLTSALEAPGSNPGLIFHYISHPIKFGAVTRIGTWDKDFLM